MKDFVFLILVIIAILIVGFIIAWEAGNYLMIAIIPLLILGVFSLLGVLLPNDSDKKGKK